jgi:hypothetical protein
MRHLPQEWNREEVIRVFNRVWDAIDGKVSTATTTKTAPTINSAAAGSYSSTGTGTKGDTGDTGATGATGAVGDILVGARFEYEVLTDAEGNILTDESGYALMGMDMTPVPLTGVDGADVGLLSRT